MYYLSKRKTKNKTLLIDNARLEVTAGGLRQLMRAGCRHLLPTPLSVTLRFYLEVDHGGSIYTSEIGKCYKHISAPSLLPPAPPPAKKSGLWNTFQHTIEIQTCVSMDHSFLMEPYNCWRYTKLPPSLPGTFRNCAGSLIFKQRSSHPGYIQNCIGWYCLDAYR